MINLLPDVPDIHPLWCERQPDWIPTPVARVETLKRLHRATYKLTRHGCIQT